MNQYITRQHELHIPELLLFFPAVAIVGPRQVGKTSLAKALAKEMEKPSIYLDLENPDDLVKLENPSLFLDRFDNHLVILDEVQKMPKLFPLLRSIIDKNRQAGRFILLGSASPDLIRDTSESLAGRIAYVELFPFIYEEIKDISDWQTHWVRGGFPESLLSPSDKLSQMWRSNFIKTYLERDLPLLGLSADPVVIGKLWRMLAHSNGAILNMENLGKSLGLHGTTIKNYLNFLESAYLIRRLPPYFSNIKKRLVKSPKVYLRDTGILHQLLAIPSFFELMGHPIIGTSWETYIIEQLAAQLPDWGELCFYRTHAGTEVDLVILKAGKPEILIEIKNTTIPKITKSMRLAQEDLDAKKQFIICPIENSFPLEPGMEAIGLKDMQVVFD